MNRVCRTPDFENLLKVLRREKPSRPTLFEFSLNDNVFKELIGERPQTASETEQLLYLAKAFAACGYDYVNTYGCSMTFSIAKKTQKQTISLNEHALITDWDSFFAYPWPDPNAYDYSKLEKIAPLLPDGMKLMISGPGGVLENVIDLIGYDNLCIMLYDDPALCEAIFNKVGSILLAYYENCVCYDTVGVLMLNDDWGFKTQTMISPDMLRKYVFPWHKKIVALAHRHQKPAVLHSCGCLNDVMEDVIEDMKFDGKHSFEDNIVPVEEAYERWGDRIAILGGIDVDFLVRSDTQSITARAKGLLELSKEKGGYALGSGNSIPAYIPNEHYFAMTSAVNEE